MIDMVRKHTITGSGNWRTIVQMVERTQEMLKMARDVSRNFVCSLPSLPSLPRVTSLTELCLGPSRRQPRACSDWVVFGLDVPRLLAGGS